MVRTLMTAEKLLMLDIFVAGSPLCWPGAINGETNLPSNTRLVVTSDQGGRGTSKRIFGAS